MPHTAYIIRLWQNWLINDNLISIWKSKVKKKLQSNTRCDFYLDVLFFVPVVLGNRLSGRAHIRMVDGITIMSEEYYTDPKLAQMVIITVSSHLQSIGSYLSSPWSQSMLSATLQVADNILRFQGDSCWILLLEKAGYWGSLLCSELEIDINILDRYRRPTFFCYSYNYSKHWVQHVTIACASFHAINMLMY